MILRLLVVVESRLWRELLVETLAQQTGLVVDEAVSTADEALAYLRERSVDLVLLHMEMPASTGALCELHRTQREIPIIGLELMEADRRTVSILEAGLAGYVAKNAGLGELLRVITIVASGGVACSPQIAAGLVRRVRYLTDSERADTRPPDQLLTQREQEILHLIEDGLANKEIAQRLDIQLATVKNHVHRILAKLGVSRRGQAAAVSKRRT